MTQHNSKGVQAMSSCTIVLYIHKRKNKRAHNTKARKLCLQVPSKVVNQKILATSEAMRLSQICAPLDTPEKSQFDK